MNRALIEPILSDIPAARQEAARHYGVHPYFTRRPSNVVKDYIEHYSRPGDVVLDPFGGSGVTAIEALLLGRKAIHNDINPFANFITSAIADTSLPSTAPLRQAFESLQTRCRQHVAQIESASEKTVAAKLKRLKLPKNIRLPRSSDAEFFQDLFTPRQLAGLSVLKTAIDEEVDPILRQLMLLAWSASVAKLNKTFLSANGRAESRGGSSIFSIYRYKVASRVIELPIWETFQGRFANVLAAKDEVLRIRDYANRSEVSGMRIDSREHLRVLADDAAALVKTLRPASVDYIFTDPPYGGHIAYLDLSILWNHWLGFPVEKSVREEEAIVGGEFRLSDDHYKRKLRESINQCMKLLRPDRWFSVVFQHWDVTYFQAILEAVRDSGGLLRAAITHDKDVIWSMHKKKNAESVLGGEMLLTFYKPVRSSSPKRTPVPSGQSLDSLLDGLLARLPSEGFRTEALFNKLIIKAWEHDSLNNIAIDHELFARALLTRGWHYDDVSHLWSQHSEKPALELF